MKKIILLFVVFCSIIGYSYDYEKCKNPSNMSYSTDDRSESYIPNVYNSYKYDVVYTSQLEIQEHILERLDWLNVKMNVYTKTQKDDIDVLKNTLGVQMVNSESIVKLLKFLIVFIVVIFILITFKTIKEW